MAAALFNVGVIGKHISAVGVRISSLGSIDEMGTAEDRMTENRYAIEKIVSNPVWGIGFNKPYRPHIYVNERRIDWFVHNGYLWILLKMGLVGFVPFMWFSYVFVKRGLRNWDKVNNSFFKGIVLGSVVSYLGMAVSNLAAPHFMQNWEVAVFGLSFGINEVIYRNEGVFL